MPPTQRVRMLTRSVRATGLRAVVAPMGIIGALALYAGTAAAANTVIGHKSSITKYGGPPAAGKLYKFLASAGQDGNPATFPVPANPALNGGLVSVARDAGVLTDVLTAGTWRPLGSGGWKYTNPAAPAGGAVKVLLIKPTSIKVLARSTGTMPVPLALNGSIDTVIVADGQQYCGHAASPHAKEVSGRLIKSAHQAPPAVCPCVLGFDSDGDRLDNCYETNTGTFVSVLDTGTDPNDADTDGDGISDGDEVLGTTAGLNLPAMGTSPLRRDILIEYDWFDDALECAAHSHRPTAAALASLAAAFAAAPTTNPDGSTGINVIQDRGQGGVFTGGNLIADADGVLSNGVDDAEYVNLKAANFNPNRSGYFHYVIMPHRYGTNSDSSGQAELPGDDMIVSLYCFGSDDNVAHTIMHELGHNLSLRHGGFQNCNFKPNYNSVMNYRYQFPGIDNDCTPPGDGVLDYSIGDRIDLDESNLDENEGVCGAPPWDWNGNAMLEMGIALDLNSDDPFEFPFCGGLQTVLKDYDDWSHVYFLGLSDADGARLVAPEIIDCDNPPPF